MRKEMALILLICVLGVPSAVLGQTRTFDGTQQPQRLFVEPPSASPLLGSARRQSARLATASRVVARQPQAKKSKGHPVLKGMLIGAGAGAGLVVATCRAGSENECPYIFAAATAGGAGIGAAVGAIIGLVRR